MSELDHKEDWAPKNCCFLNVVLEKTLESPLDSKEIKPVNPKGNQPWIFIERTDAKAPILWPPDVKSWHIGKDSEAGTDWGQEDKGVTGWDGWMASLTQWTWVWANSRRYWRTGKPGVLQSTGSQRVEHDLVTEQNKTVKLSSKVTYHFIFPSAVNESAYSFNIQYLTVFWILAILIGM